MSGSRVLCVPVRSQTTNLQLHEWPLLVQLVLTQVAGKAVRLLLRKVYQHEKLPSGEYCHFSSFPVWFSKCGLQNQGFDNGGVWGSHGHVLVSSTVMATKIRMLTISVQNFIKVWWETSNFSGRMKKSDQHSQGNNIRDQGSSRTLLREFSCPRCSFMNSKRKVKCQNCEINLRVATPMCSRPARASSEYLQLNDEDNSATLWVTDEWWICRCSAEPERKTDKVE